MPNVGFTREELKTMLPIYDVVSDCCDGDFKIKSKKAKYLPQPNSTDISSENLARYNAYLTRAIFYNVTKNTYSGLIGQIFTKEAQIDLPISLEFLKTNADGSGKGLEQLAKEGVGFIFKNSRFGLLADYPNLKSPLSAKELETGNITTTLKLYESKNIINWRTKIEGSETIYSLIVLKELNTWFDDGFELKERFQYRVLRLNETGAYQVTIYKTDSDKVGPMSTFTPIETFVPTDFNGNVLKRIPFEFCGSDNNDAYPDIPVLYDIAVLNLGHYRNSADYEESCYIVGQPTPWFAGLSEEWVKQNPTIQLGSRGAIPLPEGGSAGLLQAASNTMPIEAMKHKEEQFVALGAKLITSNNSTKTATESNIDNASETSVLSSIVANTSKAFENALKHCLKFMSPSDNEKIIFKLNNDFEISKMPVTERNQLLNEWMKGGISFTEYRDNLRKGKIAIGDNEVALKDIEEEVLNDFDMAKKDPNFVPPNQDNQNSSVGK